MVMMPHRVRAGLTKSGLHSIMTTLSGMVVVKEEETLNIGRGIRQDTIPGVSLIIKVTLKATLRLTLKGMEVKGIRHTKLLHRSTALTGRTITMSTSHNKLLRKSAELIE